MTLMTDPDVPYLPSELLTEPARPWPRSLMLTLNLILLVVAAIFVILAIGGLRTIKAERDEKARIEFCEDWAETDFPTPASCE